MSFPKKIAYTLLLIVWYTFSLLPMRIHYILSDGIYYLLYYVVRYRRKIVRKNLTDSFPNKDLKEIIEIEKGFYSYFCDYIVETVKMASISKREIMKRMKFEGTEQLIDEFKNKKSCSVYLGHYCNWEWISSLPLHLEKGDVCGQIYHPLENEIFDRLFLHVRGRFGATSIDMASSFRTIVGWHRNGIHNLVGYIADQVPGYKSMHYWTDFLNHDTPVFSGAERISRMVNSAIYYVDIFRPKRGYYVAKFIKIADSADQLPKFEITERYFRLLEKTIIRDPQYWLWSHNRWKRDREGFNREFTEEERKKILSRL